MKTTLETSRVRGSRTDTPAGADPLRSNALKDPLRDDLVVQRLAKPGGRVASKVDVSDGGGAPLSEGSRNDLEAGSGVDLSTVRVHENASEPAALGALAFTRGEHVHVGPGLMTPDIVRHEVGHVVQQREGMVRPTGMLGGLPINTDPALEAHADRGPVASTAGPATAGAVQCFFDPARIDPNALGPSLKYVKDRGTIDAAYQIALGEKGLDPAQTPAGRTLAQHALVVQQIDGEANLPGVVANVYQAADVADLVRAINIMEQETFTHGAAKGSPSKGLEPVKIGTEFTFSHPSIATMRLGDGSEKQAQQLVTAWTQMVQGGSPFKQYLQVKPAVGAKSKMAQTFTYTTKEGSFWWTLDLDEGCLETQTQPSTLPEMQGLIGKIVEADLFGGAASVKGLRPDPTESGGGGHLSLDAQSTFGGSAELFLTTLRELQARGASGEWDSQIHDTDALNAPWLFELAHKQGDATKEFQILVQQLIGQVQTGELDLDGAVARIQAFNKGIVNPMAEQRKKSSDKKTKAAGNNVADHPDHYQAVNVEHMHSSNGPAQRLELRRVPAQVSFDQFHRDVGYLFSIVQDMRSQANDAQYSRLV